MSPSCSPLSLIPQRLDRLEERRCQRRPKPEGRAEHRPCRDREKAQGRHAREAPSRHPRPCEQSVEEHDGSEESEDRAAVCGLEEERSGRRDLRRGCPGPAAEQAMAYLSDGRQALGAMPTQDTVKALFGSIPKIGVLDHTAGICQSCRWS